MSGQIQTVSFAVCVFLVSISCANSFHALHREQSNSEEDLDPDWSYNQDYHETIERSNVSTPLRKT